MEIKKDRNSNIEALRIVAMFMILMLHVNFYSLGEPSTEESITNPLPTFGRCFFESISLISVNLFVLISGWFSIKFTLKRLAAFVFQSVYIITTIYLIGLVLGYATIDEKQIKECLFMAWYGWFIRAYIGLMILSPILNYFAEYASKKIFMLVLICFFTFQTFYACFTTSATFIDRGYSTFSFIGLYLLARYVRLYGKAIIKKAELLSIIAFLGYVAWGYLPVRFGVMRIFYMSMWYTNPFNVALAISVLLLAAKMRPHTNKIINYVAASTFTVYLCHMCNTWTAHLYKTVSIGIYNTYSGITYLTAITAFIVTVFIVSIIFDQPRKWLWYKISRATLPPLLTVINNDRMQFYYLSCNH